MLPGRSPHDREILRLALPALGTLAAEPTYLLVDTAMVGHIGGDGSGQALAALALAASILGTVAMLGIVTTYATTAAVARLHGAASRDSGHDVALRQLAAQTLWLGLAIGVAGVLVVVALGPWWIEALGGRGETADDAARYLRIAAPGLGFALFSMAAQGWLRGTGNLRTPLLIVLLGNVINVVLNPILIFGLDLGLDGSAVATLIGQVTMGALFVRLLWQGSAAPSLTASPPAPASADPTDTLGIVAVSKPLATEPTVSGGPVAPSIRRPSLVLLRRLGSTGSYLLVRGVALQLAFVVASAMAARSGEPALAAHQIGWQLFLFVALVLDAIAIAGQVLIGRALGAERVDEALDASRRMVLWTVGFGLLVGLLLLVAREPILHAFTDASAVREQAREMWPLFCLMIPFGAAVFAFDGILIGAGDARFLALGMVASAAVGIPVMLVLHSAGGGLVGVWVGINVVMLARLGGTWWRYRGRRWARVGAWK